MFAGAINAELFAGLHQDPWSGRGIDMAGVHATYLADAILDGSFGRYHERRNAHALGAYRETVRLAADLRLA